MAPPPNYFEALGWWFWMGGFDYMPKRSVFPDARGGPGWGLGDVPASLGGKVGGGSVQGWKIHICVMPADIKGLFAALAAGLQKENLAHKFSPFELYAQQKTGFSAFQAIGTAEGDSAAGKACVIYPADPTVIRRIVPILDAALKTAGIRPFPGGVKGDLALGETGFIYTRYGGFQGQLADQNKVYDPAAGQVVSDPRFVKPYPAFIKVIPAEIRAVRR